MIPSLRLRASLSADCNFSNKFSIGTKRSFTNFCTAADTCSPRALVVILLSRSARILLISAARSFFIAVTVFVTSVRNALVKAKIRRGTEESGKLELFRPGQTFGEITLIKQLIKSKKLKYHVSCSCGYEFDIDPYLLTLANDHKDKVSCCVRCRTVA